MASVYTEATLHYMGAEGPEPVDQKILNGREQETTVWDQGFELIELPSKVTDWQSLDAVEAVHYEEVTEWAKGFTGCDAVLFFPALLRNMQTQAESDDYAPIQLAHSDYTENYADMIRDPDSAYQNVLKPSMERAGVSSEELAKVKRVLTLQLWRNVGDELMEYPLTVCDCTTVDRSELMPIRVESYGGQETQFDAFSLLKTPAAENHHWYAYPNMRQDEVLLFRAFDSEAVNNSKPFWTPHTAFFDTNGSGTPRSSVEMRAICLFF